MLSYQNEYSDITLREGIDEYRDYLKKNNRHVLGENCSEDEKLTILGHDATHVIFGLDTSLEQEAILDTWVLWGSKWKLKYLLGYNKLPEIKQLTKNLFKELGVLGFLKLYWRVVGIKRKVMFRAFKMKKKWPFKVPEEYLSIKISDLREKHGIQVLLGEEMEYVPIERVN